MSSKGRRTSVLARCSSKDTLALVRGLPFAQLRSTARLHERLADRMLLINAPQRVRGCARRRSRKQQIPRHSAVLWKLACAPTRGSRLAREFRSRARG
jgi:hypothetical protein